MSPRISIAVEQTRTSIGHAEQERLGVLELKVLILELFSVDALTASTVASSEVTTLEHELEDDAVERSTLEVEGLAAFASDLLASAERAEVLGGLDFRCQLPIRLNCHSLAMEG